MPWHARRRPRSGGLEKEVMAYADLQATTFGRGRGERKCWEGEGCEMGLWFFYTTLFSTSSWWFISVWAWSL